MIMRWTADGNITACCLLKSMLRCCSEQNPRSIPYVIPILRSTSTSSWISNWRSKLNMYARLPCNTIQMEFVKSCFMWSTRSGTQNTHTHTHTHLLYGSLEFVRDYPGEPVPEPIWILLEQDSEWQWWSAGPYAPRPRQITMPAPHQSVFYRPDALLATQTTASMQWRQWHTIQCSKSSIAQSYIKHQRSTVHYRCQ